VSAPDRRYEDLERRVSYLEAREPWLDYKKLADHFSTSVRTVQTWKAEGMPMELLDGKMKGQLSKILPWLETHGHEGYVSCPEPSRVVVGSNNGAAPRERPAPDTRKVGSDAQAA
jgi:hypothetical protein